MPKYISTHPILFSKMLEKKSNNFKHFNILFNNLYKCRNSYFVLLGYFGNFVYCVSLLHEWPPPDGHLPKKLPTRLSNSLLGSLPKKLPAKKLAGAALASCCAASCNDIAWERYERYARRDVNNTICAVTWTIRHIYVNRLICKLDTSLLTRIQNIPKLQNIQIPQNMNYGIYTKYKCLKLFDRLRNCWKNHLF